MQTKHVAFRPLQSTKGVDAARAKVHAPESKGSILLGSIEPFIQCGMRVSSELQIVKKGLFGAAQVRALMNGLRALPPRHIGKHEVIAVRDHATQTRLDLRSGSHTRIDDAEIADEITFEFTGGSRVTAKQSAAAEGYPQVDFCFDVHEPFAQGESPHAAEDRALARMKALADEFARIVGD